MTRSMLLALTLAACVGTSPPSAPPASQDASQTTTDAGRVDYQAELPAAPPGDLSTFVPPARGDYPEGPFGEAVRRGERIFTSTPEVMGEHMGNGLSCSSCHLDAGRRADSAPMWAAWTAYPAYRKKNDHVNSMEERLRGCFTYSLDAQHSKLGEAPEAGDPRLTDLQAYMYWLSTGVPIGAAMPGRGYPKLDEPPLPHDPARGAKVYAEKCAVCHGADGQGVLAEGQVAFPPLWGSGSYNWGAGMHRVNTAAGFIYANMPLGQARTLSEQDTWDVASFINSRPRPADPRGAGVGSPSDERFHGHDCHHGDEVDGVKLGEELR